MSAARISLAPLTLTLALALAAPALAEDEAPADDSAEAEATGAEDEIVVSAHYVETLDMLGTTSVLSEEELVRARRAQIGDTLASQPGVSATSFAPGASRPVLRGFQGARVRVLNDGLGALDASATSADHGVSIDPLTAERIEVLHGASVLLFGSQAVGGAVNVVDRRIPRRLPEGGVHLDALAGYGSAAEDRSTGGALDVAVGPKVAVHVDGSWRKTDDIETGGYVLSKELRAEQQDIAAAETLAGHPDEAAAALRLAKQRGSVPNSALETWTAGAGVAVIDGKNSLGFSAGVYDSDYGVPSRPGSEEEDVTIGMRQWRADMRASFSFGGAWIDALHLRAGHADYKHTEYEGDETGTVFRSDAWEGRAELVQADRGGWTGVVGLQGYTRDFEAIGEEAFTPPSRTDQIGLFALEKLERGPWQWEAAGRYERTTVSADSVKTAIGAGAPTRAVDRGFDAFSGALGISYEIAPELRLGLTGSRAERAPTSDELFANGPHVATQSYEVGNPDFDTERSWGVEGWLRGEVAGMQLSLSAYAQWFDNYIYEVATGAVEDDLPVYAFAQADARYWGLEGELTAPLIERDGFSLKGHLVADYVRATIDGGGNVPRIPPLRIKSGLEAEAGNFTAGVDVEHAFAQKKIAAFETPTDGFTLVGASLGWRPGGKRSETLLTLSADNIFDVEARRHASFTKDFVPLAGRDIRLNLRFGF